MVAKSETCNLCGLEIRGEAVRRSFDGKEKHFCCQGCARVYTVAHDNQMLDLVVSRPSSSMKSISQAIVKPRKSVSFSVGGMWCAGCASAAENVLRNQPGVYAADVSFAAERGRLEFDPLQIDPDAVLRKLDGLGYRARNLSDPLLQQVERRESGILIQLITATAFGMQIMLFYLVQLYPNYARGNFNDPVVRKVEFLTWALATPVLLIGGLSFLRGAWRALMARTATMDTLVALGTLSAYSYSVYGTVNGRGEVYFDSVAMITTFIMLGRYLEMIGGSQARKDIRSLLQLQPERAWRRDTGRWVEVDAKSLAVGDEILIKPGGRVPADAEILSGEAALDEAMLTGESLPVNKKPGEVLFAGTVVTDAALEACVLHPPEATRLAQITRLVEQALSIKPPIQRLADRASAYFATGIAFTALVAAVVWGLVTREASTAVLAGVAVLVVACPCALGLATPLALMVTLGQTARAGILMHNPAALETAGEIQRLVFDKTGTLTLGRLRLVAVEPVRDISDGPAELLALAAAAEQTSGHPLAKAIVSAYETAQKEAGQVIQLPAVEDVRILSGMGVTVRLPGASGSRLLVGSDQFVSLDGQNHLKEQATQYAERGESVVWLARDDQVLGFLVLRDEPNPTAAAAIATIRQRGLKVSMLSGDYPVTVKAIALELGVDEYIGRLQPEEKARYLMKWQQAGEKVAMVGDGANDAPALAQADLSITNAGGTDIAGETSDLILARPDLRLIHLFFEISSQTRRIIHQNLAWAFAYNLVAVPLAALGLIRPVIAAMTMAASSLLVVGNSLRLRSRNG